VEKYLAFVNVDSVDREGTYIIDSS
jgi:hypothetical protein